ncbi:hypothetical protein ACI8AA_02585 [Geodermatophilus sp. SYSU D01180]
MSSSRNRPEEDLARTVIEQTLGLPVELNDTCGRQGAWDFTINPAGEPQALEVVRYLDPKSIRNAAASKRYMSGEVRIAGLRRVWQLYVDDNGRHPNYSRLKRQLRAPLLAAEAAGSTEIEAYDRWTLSKPIVQPIAAALAELNLVRAWALDAPSPDLEGQVWVVTGRSFSTGLGSEPGLLELEEYLSSAEIEDVRGKLASSGMARRHAFVWLHSTGAASSWRLFGKADESELPGRPPRLPDEITDVWWLSGGRGWRWSPDGWSELGLNEVTGPTDS